jgi:hypothetical protein
LKANNKTRQLAIALRDEDVRSVRDVLLEVPSFEAYTELVRTLGIGRALDVRELGRTATTYATLGEITGVSARVHGEGLYWTPNEPSPDEFVSIALECFRDLDRGEGLVATGAWLEQLVRKYGVHPEVARLRLSDASAKGLLFRTTEGSTTDTKFDSHAIRVLRVEAGMPLIQKIYLYRGDYLIAGKSSVSLKIEDRRA